MSVLGAGDRRTENPGNYFQWMEPQLIASGTCTAGLELMGQLKLDNYGGEIYENYFIGIKHGMGNPQMI